MGIKGLKSTQLANNPSIPVPKFNFKTYTIGQSYQNNSENIDFVTYNGSLYVCASTPSITATKSDPEENGGFLLIVAKGQDGAQGRQGKDGAPGKMPEIGARFNGTQLEIFDSTGTRLTTSPNLAGKAGKPVKNGSKISGELSKDNNVPSDIDLDDLRPLEARPLLLRVDSDNTKRSGEESGPANMIQWKHEGDANWTNLISISELMNIALAGVSFWPDEETNKGHFGHKKVISAIYDAGKDGEKIISDVELGDVLFDAGELPFMNYELDFNELRRRLDDLEDGIGIDAYTKSQSDAKYQPKGNYLTQHQSLEGLVRSITINGERKTPNTTGNISFEIAVGGNVLFDVRFDENTHKLQKTTDGSVGSDLLDLDDYTGGTGGGGMSESAIKHMIGQILEGTLDSAIPEYVKGSDHDYFIRLSALENYTTVNQVTGMIHDAMTGQNIDYYRVFTLYQRTNSPTTAPAKPVVGVWEGNTAANVDAIALKPNTSSAGSNHPENATTSTPYLGMTSATYSYLTKSEVGQDPGETPICLTAEPGEDGADGNGVEFIYTLVDSLAEFNALTTPIAPETGPDSYPDPGQDHPEGVSEEHPIEAASVRKYNGVTEQWEAYCEPFIGSKGGEDGVDGDGVEYIFHVDASDTLSNNLIPAQTLEDIYYTTNGQIDYSRPKPYYENYDTSDGVPDGQNGRPDQNGSDNPSDVDEQQPYEGVSIRKYNGQTGHGGPFSVPKIGGLGGQKTVIQQEVVSGTTVYKSYNCYAFTRTNLDISGYRVTGGQAYDNPLNGIVTKNGDTIVQMTWFDGIPNGTEQLGSIQALIGDESQSSDAAGSSPARVGDRPGFQVEFAASDINTDAIYNKTKTLPSLNNYLADTPEGVDEVAGRNAVSTANCGSGSDTSDENTVYMAESRIVAGYGTPGNVIKIKGETGEQGPAGPQGLNGSNGADGTDIEFVYYRTANENQRPGMSATEGSYDGTTASSEDPYLDNFLPKATANGFTLQDGTYWHDHPSGVNENLTCEWVGIRHSSYQNGQKLWSNFNIALWSKYGANGRDGDGIEYVFGGLTEGQSALVTGEVLPTRLSDLAYRDGTKKISDSECLPSITLGSTTIKAVDDNPGVTENEPYVYASMRRYNGTSKAGGEFSAIKLWLIKQDDVASSGILDIQNSVCPITVDSNGVLDDTSHYFGSNVELRNSRVLMNIDSIIINGTNSGSINVTYNYDTETATYDGTQTVVITDEDGISATVGIYSAGCREDRRCSIRLKVTFNKVNGQNPTLTKPFIIPITGVNNTFGVNFSGTDFFRLSPTTEKQINLTERNSKLGTTSRGSGDYHAGYANQIDAYFAGSDELLTNSKCKYFFKFDDQANYVSFATPVATLNSNGKYQITYNGATITDGNSNQTLNLYFDKNGNAVNNQNDAAFMIHIANVDSGDNSDPGTRWVSGANIYYNKFYSTHVDGQNDYPIDNVVIGVGWNDSIEPVDYETIPILYDGKSGDKGDTTEKMYFLTQTLEPYNTAFEALRNNYNTALEDYKGPTANGSSTIATTINESVAYCLNVVGGDGYTTTPMSKNIPSFTSANKYRWVIERTVTYSGDTAIPRSGSIPVLDGHDAIDGNNGKTVRISVGEPYKKYYDGTVSVNGVNYLDIVTTTAISTNGGSGVLYYMCVSEHTSSSTFTADQSTKGQRLNSDTPVITPFILANKISANDIDVESIAANSAFVNNLEVKHLDGADGTFTGGIKYLYESLGPEEENNSHILFRSGYNDSNAAFVNMGKLLHTGSTHIKSAGGQHDSNVYFFDYDNYDQFEGRRFTFMVPPRKMIGGVITYVMGDHTGPYGVAENTAVNNMETTDDASTYRSNFRKATKSNVTFMHPMLNSGPSGIEIPANGYLEVELVCEYDPSSDYNYNLFAYIISQKGCIAVYATKDDTLVGGGYTYSAKSLDTGATESYYGLKSIDMITQHLSDTL